ncbi:methylase involved in ubiquinone/menaquinone biosynthesis [Beggiatoa alba B18LD]|uniref:Methylase involved in ubiquinone/menaquinone biosynthesis n=1 Tax=Beggiatoa alba B18LD TaxID=395493 RepID=I3CHS9_9GAMM|nr:class I SAM-dependent methyltransferase [Beggiatoa alba]EIJ43172.1 methylase involved in ubiquinone/menaquinone biosynthesis [Beggiatoa alba B18LD]
MDQVQAMDHMYRYQRYIYDITRKYYLFGRDTLIREMPVQAGETVLEMGCGTARNLLLLANRYPKAQFYGLDASNEMLITAQQKVAKSPYANHIHLTQALAEELNYNQLFHLNKPFDKIFFSYALSMIPPWQQALQAALQNLKVGGELHIVDFSDQRDLPRWFQYVLTRWLDLFGVHYPPDLLPYLENMEKQGQGTLTTRGLGGHYAFLACFKKK